jgi:polysaccharide pyruvyl transferase WcaK-like protein
MKNIILSTNLVCSGNKGCEALAYSTIYVIDKILKENKIEAKLFVTRTHSQCHDEKFIIVDGEKIDFTLIDTPPLDIKTIFRAIFKPYKTLRNLSIYQKADYILDIGAGDSFSDIYGAKRFYQVYNNYALANFFNVKYCVLPQTIGPYYDKKIEKIAFETIRKSALVLIRDKQSYDYVKKNVSNANMFEVTDIAFFLPYKKKQFSKNKTHVGLNISALLWNGGYTQNNQFGLIVQYNEFIRAVIAYFLSQENVVLHLVPHVVHSVEHIENDYSVSFALCEEYNNENLILAPLFINPIIAKSYISGLDFFMGARMHATIAAFSSGVPVLPMAYSRKFNGLFIETLQYDHICDMKSDTQDIMLSKIDIAFNNRLNLAKEIKQSIEVNVNKRKELLISKLKSFLSSN